MPCSPSTTPHRTKPHVILCKYHSLDLCAIGRDATFCAAGMSASCNPNLTVGHDPTFTWTGAPDRQRLMCLHLPLLGPSSSSQTHRSLVVQRALHEPNVHARSLPVACAVERRMRAALAQNRSWCTCVPGPVITGRREALAHYWQTRNLCYGPKAKV